MSGFEPASYIVSMISISVLSGGFIFQTYKMYKHKHSHGISTFSWVQNYIGRLLFAIYMAILDKSVGIPVLISQILMSYLSIPVIYYSIRNKKTKGEYTKEHFKRRLFAFRVVLASLTTLFFIISILMTKEVDVITPDRSIITIQIMAYTASIITSFSFIPQTIKTIRTRNTKSTSLGLTILFTIGNFLFILGFVLTGLASDMLAVVAPIITISISTGGMFIILLIKIQNTRRKHESEEVPGEDIDLVV